MQQKPEYSFLMSVYCKDKPEYLRLSLDSMLEQTYEPGQIVLVEDGYIDKELHDVIDEYLNKYPQKITIVVLETNKGLGIALNEGLKKCKYELVARMDADDICVKERCMLQVNEFVKDPVLDIVGGYTDEFEDNPENIISSRIVPLNQDEIVKFAKRRSPFNHPTVMYKKSSVMKVGGYGDYRRAQDYDLFTRMLNEGHCEAKNIDKALLLYRSDRDNIARRKSFKTCTNYIKMVYGFYKKNYVGITDLMFVVCSQLVLCLIPAAFAKKISETFFRKKR